MTYEWTSERISALMVFWKEGHSTSVIGSKLGVTKNAVVGKVHRLGLPKRGSPIKQKIKKPAEIIDLEKLRSNMCVWPYGEPGTSDFRFCGEKVVPDKPYCDVHCKTAYVRPGRDEKAKGIRGRQPAIA